MYKQSMLKNTKDTFGWLAKSFHWVIALLIIGMWVAGQVMTSMENTPTKFEVYFFHKATGITVLALAVLAIAWRSINVKPALTHLPKWQVLAATLNKYGLYFCMLAMPLTGWMMSSAAGRPVSFFGLFIMPDLVPVDKEAAHIYAERHEQVALLLLALFLTHAGAALMHHFILKDGILKRMLPKISK